MGKAGDLGAIEKLQSHVFAKAAILAQLQQCCSNITASVGALKGHTCKKLLLLRLK